jgi:hypothetical protein
VEKLKKIGISFLIVGIIFLLIATQQYVGYQIWWENKQLANAHCVATSHIPCGMTQELNMGEIDAKFYVSIGVIPIAIGITLLVINRINNS